MEIKVNSYDLLNKVRLKSFGNNSHETDFNNNVSRPIIFKTTYTSRQRSIKFNDCLVFTESLWSDQNNNK
jgi:hypothetical protein